MKKLLTLIVHRTYFVIAPHDEKVFEIMYDVTNKLKSHKYVYNRRIRRMVREEDKKYFSYTYKDKTYRFTISILKDVLSMLGRRGITKEEITVISVLNKNVRPLNLNFNDNKFELRDYQKTYSNILVNERKNKSIMLVDLATGHGKTVIAAHSLVRINEVTMILVLPKYIEKWRDDLYKYTNIKEKDIFFIKGSKSIIELMNQPRHTIKYKAFIASITTMNYMISDYESEGAYELQGYTMCPYDFMDHIGVGVILNDETHQHFHALLKISLYMNVNQIIGLSATLDSHRDEMKRLYSYMFPSDNRISNIAKIEKYTYVKAIEYRLSDMKGVQYSTPQGYNHIKYEHSIMKSKCFMQNYFNMIFHYVEKDYIKRKQDGERLLIFMASIALCTAFTNYLKNKYPSMDIRRYVEDDPYENILNAEISVSTVISASTAVDIPKLITVINTISMASLQANLQTMGRLRKIPGRDVWYDYIYCPQIPNQKHMHKIRRDTIKDKAKLIVYDEYPLTIMTR